MDFLEGEWGAQQILGEALATFDVARSDGFFPAVDVEAAVFPGEEIGDLLGVEVFFVAGIWRKRWRKSSVTGAGDSSGMAWKRPSSSNRPSAARMWRCGW
jgi:hypothetical protein